jgi:hypothetical protein
MGVRWGAGISRSREIRPSLSKETCRLKKVSVYIALYFRQYLNNGFDIKGELSHSQYATLGKNFNKRFLKSLGSKGKEG